MGDVPAAKPTQPEMGSSDIATRSSSQSVAGHEDTAQDPKQVD
jgi:hypothetical protein